MNCMSKKVLISKRKIEAKQEQLRWNSLSAEEREKELAERAKSRKKSQRFGNTLNEFASAVSKCCFGETYTKNL